MRTALDVRDLVQGDYWRALCPDAPLNVEPFGAEEALYRIDEQALQSARASLLAHGYFALPAIIDVAEMARIARIVQSVTAAGLPAPFALVYDPIWRTLKRLVPLMTGLLGPEASFAPDDFWIWQLDGQHESTGWGWHRDRWQDPGHFDEQRRPLTLTLWIPFTDATLENGCIEVLPTSCDPNFPDHLERDTVGPESRPLVRHLPAAAGAPLGWDVRLLHRGGAYAPHARAPRISMGMHMQNTAFEGLDGRAGVADAISLVDRLALVGSTVVQYRDRYPLPADLLDACKLWKALREIKAARDRAR